MTATPIRRSREGRRTELKYSQRICDRYELEKPLQPGAQSEVWVARVVRDEQDERDEQNGTRVVLKFFPETTGDEDPARFQSAFQTERAALEQIVSPYVLKPIDQGVHQRRRPFLVTEYIEGGSDLVTWASQRAPAPRGWDVLQGMFRSVCLGLQEAHRLGITHGDLAPRNVLVRRGETPVVLDFGMGALRHQEVFTARQHDDHSPPELMSAALAPTLDVFALGVLFVELHADARVAPGGVPWREVSARGEAALRETLTAALPAASPFLDALVAALHADPARRPQDAYGLFASLECAGGEVALGLAIWPERDELRESTRALVAEVKELRKTLGKLNALIDRYQTEYMYRVGQLIVRFERWALRNRRASKGERLPVEDEDFDAPRKPREQVKSDVSWDRRRREAAQLMHQDRYPKANEEERLTLTTLMSRANAAIDARDETEYRTVVREYHRWRDTREQPGESSGEEIARLRRMQRDLEHERVEIEREVGRSRASAEYREALAWQDDEARGVDHFASDVARLELLLAGQKNTWMGYVRSGIGS